MKKLSAIVLVLALILVGSYAYSKRSHTSDWSLQKVTVSQAFEVFLYAPLYVAQEQGFFQDEGLDVTISTAGGDEKAFAALLNGDAQFAIGDPTFTAVSGEKGQPGKVIAAVLTGVPFWGVTDNPDIKPITEPAELGRYSVATFPSPSTAFALQTKMFQSGGLKPNIKQVAFGGLLPALTAGQVDIALELEPNVSTALQNGSRKVYSLSSYYPDFAITGVTALPAYLQSNPEVAQKFVNALRRADNYIRQNPLAVAKIMSQRFTEVNPAVAESALKNIIDAQVIPKSIMVTENGWNTAVGLRLDVGDIKRPAPFTDYVDNTFAQKADKIK